VLPFGTGPATNGEFVPSEPSAHDYDIFDATLTEIEWASHRAAIDRRAFLRGAGGVAAALTVFNLAACSAASRRSQSTTSSSKGRPTTSSPTSGPGGTFSVPTTADVPACQHALAGNEFIFDVHSHHVMPHGPWRQTAPATVGLVGGIWALVEGWQPMTARGVGLVIGSSLAVYPAAGLPRVTVDGLGRLEDCLQPGNQQVCAGYVMYGSSTMLVYTTGQGVHGFTYEPSVGEFLLSHTDIRTPTRGHIYSVNEGNYFKWDDGVKRYVDWLKSDDEATGRPYSSRYVGSLVADFHRNLLYGGIYLYPGDRTNPNGKLRVLYEGAPLALIAEQAGGAASDGRVRILDLMPTSLHQRTPLYLGSAQDVKECETFVQGRNPAITAERRGSSPVRQGS
jgi:hypothetical protein